MWILRQEQEPKVSGAYKVFGTVNKGSEHETECVYNANYDGSLKRFTDQQGEDLTGIDEGVKYWFDFSQVGTPTDRKIEVLKKKAERWDNLGKKIESYYFDKDGNERPDDYGDGLCGIGEAAASAYGWL